MRPRRMRTRSAGCPGPPAKRWKKSGSQMAKRRAKKIANSTAAAPRLRRTLAKCAKAELISILVELAGEDRSVLRRLAARLEWESPPQELAAATRQAIADATDFDERDANRNFSYDYEAYGEIRRNLTRLID